MTYLLRMYIYDSLMYARAGVQLLSKNYAMNTTGTWLVLRYILLTLFYMKCWGMM